ncbi:MAG: hypothetical protein M1826_004243 [Phylliscum demangeonii]|nr:MAG: hypothetical protein M1826_004243 [Phylliscum demangeonii]
MKCERRPRRRPRRRRHPRRPVPRLAFKPFHALCIPAVNPYWEAYYLPVTGDVFLRRLNLGRVTSVQANTVDYEPGFRGLGDRRIQERVARDFGRAFAPAPEWRYRGETTLGLLSS